MDWSVNHNGDFEEQLAMGFVYLISGSLTCRTRKVFTGGMVSLELKLTEACSKSNNLWTNMGEKLCF